MKLNLLILWNFKLTLFHAIKETKVYDRFYIKHWNALSFGFTKKISVNIVHECFHQFIKIFWNF